MPVEGSLPQAGGFITSKTLMGPELCACTQVLLLGAGAKQEGLVMEGRVQQHMCTVCASSRAAVL